jgi:hypothetical protein
MRFVHWRLIHKWVSGELNMNILFSHVYREGNVCSDKLDNLSHDNVGLQWRDILPTSILRRSLWFTKLQIWMVLVGQNYVFSHLT